MPRQFTTIDRIGQQVGFSLLVIDCTLVGESAKSPPLGKWEFKCSS